MEAALPVSCRSVGLLYQLLDLLLPYMRCGRKEPAYERVEAATAYIRTHRDFQVAQLAQLCHLSESDSMPPFRPPSAGRPFKSSTKSWWKRPLTF